MKRIYEHDCEKCEFLGNYKYLDEKYDLYFCDKGLPTLIARYGDDGSEYLSGMEFGVKGQNSNINYFKPLSEAYRRAKDRNLIE